MIYETPSGKHFGMLHIPRTGGRFLRTNLLENGMKPVVWTPANNVIEYEGRKLIHLTKRELFEYLDHLGECKDLRDIPFYSICRNPLDRFYSASNNIQSNLKSRMVSEESFLRIMEKEHITVEKSSCSVKHEGLVRAPDSFFRFQTDYMDHDVDFMRYEEGFDIILEWLSDELQTKLVMKETRRVVDENEHVDQAKNITSDVLDLAKAYYIQDYIRFGYPIEEGNE